MSASWGELFRGHSGYVVDKWQQYLAVYQGCAERFIREQQPVSLLEIGVQNGGSLQIWAKLLPPGSRIVGLDINPDVAGLNFGDWPISVHVVDATDAEAVDDVLGDESFDIIIDDGSHFCSDVIKAVQLFLTRLRLGGCLIIEDLHTSYYPDFGGGYGVPSSSISFLKNIIDGLHADYIDMNAFTDGDRAQLEQFNRLIESVTFHDSIAVIQRRRSAWHGANLRLLSGTQADVVSIDRLVGVHAVGAAAIALSRTDNDKDFWQRDLQQQLESCRSRIAELEQHLPQRSR